MKGLGLVKSAERKKSTLEQDPLRPKENGKRPVSVPWGLSMEGGTSIGAIILRCEESSPIGQKQIREGALRPKEQGGRVTKEVKQSIPSLVPESALEV